VGADYRTCIVWFKKGTITASRQGGEWIVSAQIETQDKVIQSEAELVVNLLTFGSGEDAATLLDTFKHAVNYGFSAEGP
jgi:hypothetical protein